MTATENPIDNDERLRGLLSGVPDIKSRKSYNMWRKAFLKIYTKYLDPNGILNGKDANYRLLKQMGNLANRIDLFMGPFQDGEVDTPNGRRRLTNLADEVVATERKVDEFMPKTNADEERFGFDKFELAAVLLEDGFHGYDMMNNSRGVLHAIANELEGCDNEVAILTQYCNSVESFIEVMEDLKLLSIMNQCVDVVYHGKERSAPKPPPPPSQSSEDEDELPEDSSIISEQPFPQQRNGDGAGRDKTKKKGKKKKKGTSSSRNLGPTKKKKKSKKKGGGGDEYATTSGDDTDDLYDIDENEESVPSGAVLSQSNYSRKNRNNDEDDDDDSDSDSEESEDDENEDDEDEDENEAEFLLYFDPKTNTIGRINRVEAVNKSTLLVDKSDKDGPYKNLIDDQEEKQEIIFMLKKHERQKPEEASWLDEIKKEKEAAKLKNGTKPKKVNKSTAMISKRNSLSNGSGGFQSPQAEDKKKVEGETMTFRNPLTENARKPASIRNGQKSFSPKKSSKKPAVENYAALYKEVADKPDEDGWSKPASSRRLLQ